MSDDNKSINSRSKASVGKKAIFPLDGKDLVSSGTEYFRISRAAEILECTTDDLLHLGATGKAEVIAPVLAGGRFEWPVGSGGIAFPEIDEPFRIAFGAADRIILSPFDLAKIEGAGWTIPTFFYAPSKARRLIDEARTYAGISCQAEGEHIEDNQSEGVTETKAMCEITPLPEPDETEAIMREVGFHTLWHLVGSIRQSDDDPIPIDNADQVDLAKATKIEHLFVSKKELQRLKQGLPQDEYAAARNLHNGSEGVNKNIRYLDRHASVRESIWKAAVYCLVNLQKDKIKAAELCREIERAAPSLWPEHGVPPLGTSTMEEHLASAIAGRVCEVASRK